MKIQDRPEFKNKLVPFSLGSDENVFNAVKTMAAKNIGSVVIVDTEMHVKGIVTERDILRLVSEGLDPKTTPLAKIMTTDIKTAHADDEVVDWLRQMSNERFRHLPVTDEQGRLIAMMSQGDFVSYTWPDLLRDTFKGGAIQLPILFACMAAYAVAVLYIVRRS
jgi:signal-transduction protein with cAMP-binding, CBS, and nucleotidyltransferase domain